MAPGPCSQGQAEVKVGARSHVLCDFKPHVSPFRAEAPLFFGFCWSGDGVLEEMCAWLFTQLCQASSRWLRAHYQRKLPWALKLSFSERAPAQLLSSEHFCGGT